MECARATDLAADPNNRRLGYRGTENDTEIQRTTRDDLFLIFPLHFWLFSAPLYPNLLFSVSPQSTGAGG